MRPPHRSSLLPVRRLPSLLRVRRLPGVLCTRRLPGVLSARRLPGVLSARRLPGVLSARRSQRPSAVRGLPLTAVHRLSLARRVVPTRLTSLR
ncbi:hypothetical protein ACWCOV_30670 [Kribbella sp. NPDC002412]